MDGTVWVGWKDGTYEDRILRAQNGAQEGRFAGFVRLFGIGGLLFVCRFIICRRRRLLLLLSSFILFYLLSVRLV